MERKAGFSGFLGETFALIGDGARFVALYVLVVGGLEAVAVAVELVEARTIRAGVNFGFLIDGNAGLVQGVVQLALFVVSIVAQYLLCAALLDMRGRLQDGSARFLALLGLTIVASVSLVLGFVLLIVPGLILMVRWSASVGYLIGARKGVFESLGDSWNATKGYGWGIFFAGVVTMIAMGFAGGVLGSAAGTISFFAAGIVSAFIQAISTAVLSVLGIAIYLLVNAEPEGLGEIFE